MPRITDHEQRRLLVARAFQEHLADEGLAATTFARVAGAAGISVGLIQHYFTGKDELLRFAYADCLARRDERIGRLIVEGEAAEQPIRTILGRALQELLPLDRTRTVEHRVTQSLRTQALNHAALAEVARDTELDLHRRTATAVENGKECGEVAADVDAGPAAARILAAGHGLALQLALGVWSEAAPAVEPVLGPVLDTVFTGRCRHYVIEPGDGAG